MDKTQLHGKWETTTLGEIAEIRNGATPSTQVAAYWNGSIPWCIPTDITNTPGKYLIETERNITTEGLDCCAASLLPAGTLLLCTRATIGEVKIASSPVCTNQGFKSLVCKDGVSNEFLYYLIITLKPQILERAIGSTFLEIGKYALASIEVKLPPVTEQRAIAEALSDVDSLLQSLEALIAKKRAIRQTTMQQLLTGKTRLPGFSKVWETRRLGEVTSIRKGQLITESSVTPGTVPVIAGGKKPAYFHNSANRTGKTITVSASGAYAGYVAYWDEPIFASDCSTISEAPNYSIQYIFYQMLLAQKKIYHAQTGGAQPHVHGRDLDPLIISIPPIREQQAIAAILSDMDTEVDALERHREKASAVKQGMMQQLLTGRVRLVGLSATKERKAKVVYTKGGHSPQFNEAVAISVLAKKFGTEQYPLGRLRYTKLLYLHHRHQEGHAEGYLKKAAGPYNPGNRYRGPENIALQKSYIRRHRSGKWQGFVAGTNIGQAEQYFGKWYGEDALNWLEQFRFEGNERLELLTTVDMAVEELRESDKAISVGSVKAFIRREPEWQAKLARLSFSDAKLAQAIADCRRLFDPDEKRQAS